MTKGIPPSDRYVPIERIDGLIVYYIDGTVSRKDFNNIWMYHCFYRSQFEVWENRRYEIDMDGKLQVIFK